MVTTPDFGAILRRARKARGLSQAQVCKALGLKQAAMSHYETNARRPSLQRLIELADVLQVTTDHLCGRGPDRGAFALGNDDSDQWADSALRAELRRQKREIEALRATRPEMKS